jgi:hypothetical protein
MSWRLSAVDQHPGQRLTFISLHVRDPQQRKNHPGVENHDDEQQGGGLECAYRLNAKLSHHGIRIALEAGAMVEPCPLIAVTTQSMLWPESVAVTMV